MLGFSGLISRNSFRGFGDFQGCLAGALDRDETRERGRARVWALVGAWGRLWAAGGACGRLGLYINLQISVGPGLGPGRE